MPINIQFQPPAATIGQAALLGGQGQFEQARDRFAFDVDQFNRQLGERQRQFNIGTQFDVLSLDQRRRAQREQIAAQLLGQRMQNRARERLAMFDAQQRQALDQQDFGQALALQRQQALAQAEQQRLRRFGDIQDRQMQAAFRQRQAELEAIQRQMPQIRDPQAREELLQQFNAKWQGSGLPPVGAEQFAPPRPDPMEQLQQQAQQINEQLYDGHPVAYVTPDGSLETADWTKTPRGLEQKHQQDLQREQLQQQQDMREAQVQRQQDLQKQIQEMEANRRKYAQQFADAAQKAQASDTLSASILGVPENASYNDFLQKGYDQWDQANRGALEALRGEMAGGEPTRQAEQPPPEPQPVTQEEVQQEAEVSQAQVYQQVVPRVVPNELLGTESQFPIARAFRPEHMPIVNDMLRQAANSPQAIFAPSTRPEDLAGVFPPHPQREQILARAYLENARENFTESQRLYAKALLPNVSTQKQANQIRPGAYYYDTRIDQAVQAD